MNILIDGIFSGTRSENLKKILVAMEKAGTPVISIQIRFETYPSMLFQVFAKPKISFKTYPYSDALIDEIERIEAMLSDIK